MEGITIEPIQYQSESENLQNIWAALIHYANISNNFVRWWAEPRCSAAARLCSSAKKTSLKLDGKQKGSSDKSEDTANLWTFSQARRAPVTAGSHFKKKVKCV